MKYITEYLISQCKIKPLGKVTLENDVHYDLSGVNVLIDGKNVDIFVAHIDYCNWLESLFGDDEVKAKFTDITNN